jgi:hypothetical protein
MTGVELIAAERQRQMEQEGWTPAHDDTHDEGELRDAAIAYALTVDARTEAATIRDRWPWEPSWWKPSDDPLRNLAKAGALIAAEIDRLQRARKE